MAHRIFTVLTQADNALLTFLTAGTWVENELKKKVH